VKLRTDPALSDATFLADVDTTAGVSGLHLWWLGQSGYLMKYGPWLVVADPYLSDSLTNKYATTDKPHVRMSRRVIDPELLCEIAFVTCSHGHTDHLDAETLRAVRRHNHPTLIAPRAIRGLAEERWGADPNGITFMSDGESQVWGDIAVRAVPAAHDALERDEAGNSRFLGFVFGFGPGQFTVYHSGDTVVFDGMADLLRPFNIDIAILPINGKVGNMGGRDAARLAKDIGARVVIPCHYDMFEFNTADPREEFVPECERLGQPYRVLRLGERFSSPEIPPR
jgi:L-ascorbate metabolism protein UlaG (beta-lactamase superfamily)